MAYCKNCGNSLRDGAGFCDKCGSAVRSTNDENQRKTVYDGKIHKCPNCGEVLGSFSSNCPACGFELRDTESSSSIQAFFKTLQNAETQQKKIDIINGYPIPNTKEDILEFMIIAASMIKTSDIDDELFDAWKAKTEQAYTKACLALHDRNDRQVIEEEYNKITEIFNKKLKQRDKNRSTSALSGFVSLLPYILPTFFWFVGLFIFLPLGKDAIDNINCDLYRVLYLLSLLAGVFFVPAVSKRGGILSKLLVTSGSILNTGFLILLSARDPVDGSTDPFRLFLLIAIPCFLRICIRVLKHHEPADEKYKPTGKMLLGTLVGSLVCFSALFFIGDILTPVHNVPDIVVDVSSPVLSEDPETDEEQGIFVSEIRNYTGKNAASVGKVYGGFIIDKYGYAELRIIFVTENGMTFGQTDDEELKDYVVVGQNIPPKSKFAVVHQRNDKGEIYNTFVDYQSYDEIILYIAHAGDISYVPDYTTISPVRDKHAYHIRDYVGRNAASFGYNYGDDRIDDYGVCEVKLSFTSDEGSFVDDEDENILKEYIIIAQDPEPDSILDIQYKKDSKGRESDYFVKNQSYGEINLTVHKLDESIISAMPDLGRAEEE